MQRARTPTNGCLLRFGQPEHSLLDSSYSGVVKNFMPSRPTRTSSRGARLIGAPTVAVSDVSMRYRTQSAGGEDGSRFTRNARRILGKGTTVSVRALSGVSFLARAGESIGIVGRNGSGKSTILRIIAGLEHPTRGTVLAESTPVLLGVNAALLPDLPGIQNIRLGLLALGKSPDEVTELIPEIQEVAGIGRSILLPMKTYSSGMASRLRFAIAAAARPNILLIDEALSTGDAAFKERSEQTMADLRANAGTVFLVSHAAQTVEEMCTRAIWLHKGRVVMDGPAYETAQKYRWWSWKVAQGEHETADEILSKAMRQQRVSDVTIVEADRLPTTAPRHARQHTTHARKRILSR